MAVDLKDRESLPGTELREIESGVTEEFMSNPDFEKVRAYWMALVRRKGFSFYEQSCAAENLLLLIKENPKRLRKFAEETVADLGEESFRRIFLSDLLDFDYGRAWDHRYEQARKSGRQEEDAKRDADYFIRCVISDPEARLALYKNLGEEIFARAFDRDRGSDGESCRFTCTACGGSGVRRRHVNFCPCCGSRVPETNIESISDDG